MFYKTLGATKTHLNLLELFYSYLQESFYQTTNCKKIPQKKI